MDIIYLKNLQLAAVVGKDAWQRPNKKQPVVISLRLEWDIGRAGATDDIDDTLSYGQICKDVTSWVESQETFWSLPVLNDSIVSLAGRQRWGGKELHITTVLPKASLRAEGGLTLETSFYTPDVRLIREPSFHVKGLRLACIIGVNAHERERSQTVVVNLRIIQDSKRADKYAASHPLPLSTTTCHAGHWFDTIEGIVHTIEKSSYETLEALATHVAQTCLFDWPIDVITVTIEKPSALAFVEAAGIEITRSAEHFSYDYDP